MPALPFSKVLGLFHRRCVSEAPVDTLARFEDVETLLHVPEYEIVLELRTPNLFWSWNLRTPYPIPYLNYSRCLYLAHGDGGYLAT